MTRNSDFMQARLDKNNASKVSGAEYYMYFLGGYLIFTGIIVYR